MQNRDPKVDKTTNDKIKCQLQKPVNKINTSNRQLLCTKNTPQEPKISAKPNSEDTSTKRNKDVQHMITDKNETDKTINLETLKFSKFKHNKNVAKY